MKRDEDGTTLAFGLPVFRSYGYNRRPQYTRIRRRTILSIYLYTNRPPVDSGRSLNLSDKRKSKEILETSRKICHANSIIVTHPI